MKLEIILLLRLRKESWWANDYIDFFYYFDNSLTVSSVTTGSISITSFETVIWAAVGMVCASVSLPLSISTRIVKETVKKKQEIRKKKHNKIVMLARSKLNSLETKIPEALINNEISCKDFVTNFNESKNIGN